MTPDESWRGDRQSAPTCKTAGQRLAANRMQTDTGQAVRKDVPMPSDYDQRVEVVHDGRWYPCEIRDRRRDPTRGWRYLLTYSIGAGQTYLHWRPSTELRSAGSPDIGA
jgi:hypothetical protein